MRWFLKKVVIFEWLNLYVYKGIGLLKEFSKLLRPYWKQASLSLFFSLATIASSIGLLGTSAYLLSRAAQQPSIAALQVSIVGVRFLGISRGVFRYLERLASHSVNFHLLKELRVWFYRMIEPRVPAIFATHPSGDLLARSTADIDTLENFYHRVVSPPLVAFLMTVGGAVLMGSFSAILGVTLAIGMTLTGLTVPLIVHFVNRRSGEEFLKARAALHVTLIENLQGMADLLVFGYQKRALEDTERLINRAGVIQSRMNAGIALARSLNVWLPGLTLLVILLQAVDLIGRSRLDAVYLAVLAMITLASFEAITPMGEAAASFDLCKSAYERLFSLEKIAIPVKATRMGLKPENVSLVVENLRFRHGADSDELLRGISFDLPVGKRIGLAGPNGSGKTTLLHLLLRFLEYESGSIRIGNCELREIDVCELRKRITILSQSTYIFSGTLRENLLLGKPGASDETLLAAIEWVELGDWFRGLPNGLDAWVGEQGVRLSGGERRRLVMARSLLRDADIYLFDEPELYLDPLTASRINEMLRKITAGKSVLWVSHCLADLAPMDEIIVLNQGRIYERGSYATLIHQNGLFAQMEKAQKGYIPDYLEDASGMI